MTETEKQAIKQHEGNAFTQEELIREKTVDTVHQDEALKVISQYAGDMTWTQEEEKKVVQRIDRKLMPLLCITYGLQYYDKAMLSQAALFGLREDLGLNIGNRYSFSVSHPKSLTCV